MKKWKKYHSDVNNKKFDSIIIGSGIGGLCAAALLAIKGKQVLVLKNILRLVNGHLLSREKTMSGMLAYTTLVKYIDHLLL